MNRVPSPTTYERPSGGADYDPTGSNTNNNNTDDNILTTFDDESGLGIINTEATSNGSFVLPSSTSYNRSNNNGIGGSSSSANAVTAGSNNTTKFQPTAAAAAAATSCSGSGQGYAQQHHQQQKQSNHHNPYQEEEDDDECIFKIPDRFSRTGKKRAVSFPLKLMQVLSMKKYKDIICWLPEGISFHIVDREKLTSIVLPRHFKESKFESFARKLLRWGFENRKQYYLHKDFNRDCTVEDIDAKITCHNDKKVEHGGDGNTVKTKKKRKRTTKKKQEEEVGKNKMIDDQSSFFDKFPNNRGGHSSHRGMYPSDSIGGMKEMSSLPLNRGEGRFFYLNEGEQGHNFPLRYSQGGGGGGGGPMPATGMSTRYLKDGFLQDLEPEALPNQYPNRQNYGYDNNNNTSGGGGGGDFNVLQRYNQYNSSDLRRDTSMFSNSQRGDGYYHQQQQNQQQMQYPRQRRESFNEQQQYMWQQQQQQSTPMQDNFHKPEPYPITLDTPVQRSSQAPYQQRSSNGNNAEASSEQIETLKCLRAVEDELAQVKLLIDRQKNYLREFQDKMSDSAVGDANALPTPVADPVTVAGGHSTSPLHKAAATLGSLSSEDMSSFATTTNKLSPESESNTCDDKKVHPKETMPTTNMQETDCNMQQSFSQSTKNTAGAMVEDSDTLANAAKRNSLSNHDDEYNSFNTTSLATEIEIEKEVRRRVRMRLKQRMEEEKMGDTSFDDSSANNKNKNDSINPETGGGSEDAEDTQIWKI